jgi:photosystem II stability/assembly factor-like uncharacterized protein
VQLAVSVLIAVVVAVAALSGLHAGHRVRSHRSAATPAMTVPGLPADGMRGVVSLAGAGFDSLSDGIISLQQCLNCGDGHQPRQAAIRYWLARTSDGGTTWRLTAVGYSLQQPLFAGRDGWAGGLQAAGSTAEYFVTHDGGRTWQTAPAAAPNEGGSVVSIGGGEVWATGLSQNVAILHAAADSGRLAATPAQPIRGDWTNVLVIAGGREIAYVTNGNAPRQTFVTHDGGRSWQRIPPLCPAAAGGVLLAAYGNTVWAECQQPPARQPQIALEWSPDGGRTWERRAPTTASAVERIQPVSARVAWALSADGVIRRTTDGGQTWSQVWSAAGSQPATLKTAVSIANAAGSPPILIAQSPTTASIVMTLTRGNGRQQRTNVVLYRTTDGGRSWRPQVVALARR